MSSKYVFPYHHLPVDRGASRVTGRDMRYGLSYLGYLGEVVNEVVAANPKRVLEVGCGDGRLASVLMERTQCGYVGVDVDERATLYARAFTFHTPATIVCGDVRDLDQSDFDVALSSEVLEHVGDEDIDSVVAAVHDRLRPGGVFVVTVPAANVPLTRAHYRHYTPEQLIGLMAPHFDVIEIRPLNQTGWRLKVCERLLVNRFFALRHGLTTRLIRAYYERFLLRTNEAHASQLLGVFKKKG